MKKAPPQRRSKRARATDTSDQLLAAAREVVAERGVAGATSRAITDAAGANLAAITYHFGSKDDLVAEALLAEIAQLVEPALTALEGDADPAARLLDAVQLLLGRFAAETVRVPLYAEAVAAELRGDTVGVGDLVARARDRLCTVVEQLRADGVVPDWVEPEAMAALIVGASQGIVLQHALDPSGPGVEAQAAQLAQLLVHART